jgi:hypothetical protein
LLRRDPRTSVARLVPQLIGRLRRQRTGADHCGTSSN